MYLKEIENNYYMLGSFNKTELHYMIHYLIGFGKHIVIENPKILKDAYIAELKNILKFYR